MRFNEEYHTYVDEHGEIYTSATSFIKSFCKPFDKITIATKYAKKHKKKIEEVLAEWDKAGKDAIHKGTLFHKMKEEELLAQPSVYIEDEEHIIVPSTYENGDKVTYSQKLEPGVYPELCVWSEKYKIAGQADYVEITKKGLINIQDYKTSKEIKKEAYKDWRGRVDKLKFPLQHLDDCNFWHYSLQLNLYAFLIKQQNRKLKIGSMTIKHILGDLDSKGKFKLKEIVDYKVPNLQKEIKIALEYYNSTK